MKCVLAAVAVSALLLLGMPGTAPAHYSGGWYWSESLAATRIEARYSDVVFADCLGWGKRHRHSDDRSVWLYKHFDCFLELDDGTTEEDELHVTGRRGFKLLD